jgi:exopolysaccharide production protein ExoQ
LVMLIVWAVLSASWSPDPAISFKRVVAFLCGIVLLVGLVRQFEMERLAEMTVVHAMAAAFIGLVVELVLKRPPALLQEEYRFAGTVHPNHQGVYAAVMLLCCMYLGWIKSDRRFFILAFISIVILLATKSRTALAAVIVGGAVFVTLVWSPRQRLVTFMVLSTVIVGTWMLDMAGAFTNLEQTVLLDRHNADPTTLTGRTVIWEFAIDKIRDDSTRIITGFGYGGFWTKDMVAELDSRAHFKLAEGHNAFLDLFLQGGMVASFLYFWGFFTAGALLLKRARRQKSIASAFGVSLLAFAFIHYIAESGLLDVTYPSIMCWVPLAIAAFRPPTDGVPIAARIGGVR